MDRDSGHGGLLTGHQETHHPPEIRVPTERYDVGELVADRVTARCRDGQPSREADADDADLAVVRVFALLCQPRHGILDRVGRGGRDPGGPPVWRRERHYTETGIGAAVG